MDVRLGRAAVEPDVQHEPEVAPHADAEYALQPHADGDADLGADDEHELRGDAAGIVVVPLDVLEPVVERHAGGDASLHEDFEVEIPVQGDAEQG